MKASSVSKTNQPWMDLAACRGLTPDIFYPVSDELAGPALSICKTCPVRVSCLEYAISAKETEGVWGATTAKDRRRIIRLRRKSA